MYLSMIIVYDLSSIDTLVYIDYFSDRNSDAEKGLRMQATYKTKIKANGRRFDITIRPSRPSSRIIINYPGFGGHINGFNDKYVTLGQHIADSHLGTYIQMPNTVWPNNDYGDTLFEDLLAVVAYVKDTGMYLCNFDNPELCLVGFSVGAGAIAAVASEAGAVKILLMSPATDVGVDKIKTGLSAYTGELYVVAGADDEVVSCDAASTFLKLATKAKCRQLEIIPDCDHQFSGEKNGQIMSKAHWWAFDHEDSFPDPEGGLILY